VRDTPGESAIRADPAGTVTAQVRRVRQARLNRVRAGIRI
jgi:hypothetical protein